MYKMPNKRFANHELSLLSFKNHPHNTLYTTTILRSSPALEVGMPVLRANCCFTLVMPKARFQEKERPGMRVDVLVMTIRLMILSQTKKYYFVSSILLNKSRTKRAGKAKVWSPSSL